MSRHLLLAALLLLGTAGCWQYRAGYCDQSHPQCASGLTCDVRTHHCVLPDALGTGGTGGTGGAGGAGGHDAGMDLGPPPCDLDAHACPPDKPFCDPDGLCKSCDMTAQSCSALDATRPVCRPAGDAGAPAICVECQTMADCHGDKPVCGPSNTCIGCRSDADCSAVGPGVCSQDGHCASADEVVIVDETAGCPDGGAPHAFCTLASGVAALTPSAHIMIIVGGTGDRLTLATTNLSPVIIGRPNSAGDPGSIPATTGTALTISSDTVVVRDLTINLGSSSNSKGIVVTGNVTSAQILRVTTSLGMGLGIDVEDGATATVDESYILNNAAGGVLVNGAAATVQNSVLAGNGGTSGFGVQFNNAAAGTSFWFNTVVNNPIAAVCSLGSTVTLQDSILQGPSTCSSMDSLSPPPTFASARPFHLSSHAPCPTAPAAPYPDHDVDGEPRGTSPDCGADQYAGD